MTVELARDGDFAILTLRRPKALNALSFEVIERIDRSLAEAEASDARALIVTGEGARAFCAGADIGELTAETPIGVRRHMRRGQLVFQRLAHLPMPSVAAINGFALGGGLELAMACTFRVAVGNARLGLPEIKLGLVPGYGGTQRLPRLVGEGRALEIVMSGRFVEAEEAMHIGLVHRIVEPDTEGSIVGGAKEFMRTFMGFGLPALAMARQAVARAGDVALERGLEIEADLNALAFSTDDAREGTAAFVEKRAARFRDR